MIIERGLFLSNILSAYLFRDKFLGFSRMLLVFLVTLGETVDFNLQSITKRSKYLVTYKSSMGDTETRGNRNKRREQFLC